LKAKDFISNDERKIKWVENLIKSFEKNTELKFISSDVVNANYRPFLKQKYYYSKPLNWSRYLQPQLFPSEKEANILICVSGVGANKGFSVLLTELVPNYHFLDTMQTYPLYYYEESKKQSRSLFDTNEGNSEYIRRDGVSDFILERSKKQFGKNVSKEDIFYYVYGFLHSPEYRTMFANDLKKMLPRLPLVDDVRDFWKFSKAGRELAGLHLNYETVPAYEGVTVKGADNGFYKVEKMRFPKKDQKDTIIFNSKIIIENIPEKAYEYVVNGKSAIEWIMERYQITTHKESGIKNDPNDWADEVGNPRYILDLLLSVINVSIKTVDILKSLPKISFA